MTKYMTASEAYRKANDQVSFSAGWLSKANDKTIAKLAIELDALADYFEANPERWTKGAMRSGDKVCSVGLFRATMRKAAGINNFVRPAEVDRVVGTDFIISLNDSSIGADYHGAYYRYMGPKNIVRTYRQVAAGLRQMIDARQAAKYAGVSFRSNDVEALFAKRLEAAARKAEWNKVHKAQRKPTPKGEGWDAEHQLGTVKAKTAKKGSK